MRTEEKKFEGMQQGEKKGKQQEREKVAMRLIEVGMDTVSIAKATSLSPQRVQELCASNSVAKKG